MSNAEPITAENFGAALDPSLMDALQETFARAHAHEGTIWLVDRDEESLVPVYNSGPRASQFVRQFRQPLKSGLISMVFASEQPFLETNVLENSRQSKLLDGRLQVRTTALMAAPLYLAKTCRGVISCVQLESGPSLPSFTGDDLNSFLRGVAQCARLLEDRLQDR